MDSNKISNWLQVAGNFGLLAGLVLVAVQINQNSGEIEQSRKLAYGQMLAETYGQINDT